MGHRATSWSRSKSDPPWARLTTWWTSRAPQRPQAWQRQRARRNTTRRIAAHSSRVAAGRPAARAPPSRMRRRAAAPTRTLARSDRLSIDAARRLPTWANPISAPQARRRRTAWANRPLHRDDVVGACWAGPPASLDLPLPEALPAASEEDPDRVRRSHDLGPDVKESLHQLHGLDVGHCRQDRTPEALARRTGLTAPGQRLERGRDLLLQGHGRQLPRPLKPRLPFPQPLDGWNHDGRLSEANCRDGRTELRALRLREARQHAPDRQPLVRCPPRGQAKHVSEVSLLGVVRAPVRPPDLAPVPVRVHLPGKLTGQYPVWFDPIAEGLQREVQRLGPVPWSVLRQEPRHRGPGAPRRGALCQHGAHRTSVALVGD